jgi:hypothetical protein
LTALVNVHTTSFPNGDSYTVTFSLTEDEAKRLVHTSWHTVLGETAQLTWTAHKIRLLVRVSNRRIAEISDDAATWVQNRLAELLG